MTKVFLIGMPGAGKSYWGKLVSEHMGLSFADLDDMIEAEEKRSIADIFEQEGEGYFRKVEAGVLEQLANKEYRVIACGGGTPVFGTNMQLMKETGCVIYLEEDISTIAERLKSAISSRPLLAAEGDLVGKLKKLYERRKARYEEADYILAKNNITLINLEQIIQSCIDRR